MMKKNTGAELDLTELKYNWFYRDYSYWASKFPAGHESIPGFEKIIQSMADNALTPLEEIELRKNKSLNNDNVECGEEFTMGQGLHTENRD